jgi:hypothetical protein
MATVNVAAGPHTIQDAVNAAPAAATTFLLGAGTYTLDGRFLFLLAAVVGHSCSNYTFQGVDRDTVIIDITDSSASGNDSIYGGDAANVTLKDMTITGTPAGGAAFLRDAALTVYTGWTFDNIKFNNTHITPFKLGYNMALGTGITIKNIVTTANFGGTAYNALASVIDITGPASDLGLTIDNIDCRLNNGFVKRVVYGIDIRDAVIRNIKGYGLYGGAVRLLAVTNGNYRVSVTNVYLDNAWDGVDVGAQPTSPHYAGVAEPGCYSGNPEESAVRVSRQVHFSNIHIRNNASYGIELENDAQYCSVVGFRIYNVHGNGLPLAEETQNNTVSDGTIDTVRGTGNPGIALAHTAYNKVSRVTISNCDWGIRHVDAYKHVDNVTPFITRNLKNEISDCVFINVTTPYYVELNSLTNAGTESIAYAGAFANNKVYGTFTSYSIVSYGLADDRNKTQAEFEALFPHTVKRSDTVSTDPPNYLRYAPLVALNLLAGNTGSLSDQFDPEIVCLNKMVVGSSPPYTNYSPMVALNTLVGP